MSRPEWAQNPWKQNPWFESVAVAQRRARKRLPEPVYAASEFVSNLFRTAGLTTISTLDLPNTYPIIVGEIPAPPGAPTVRERIEGLGAVIVSEDRATPEYLGQFVKSEIEKWAAPIKASGVTVD